MSKPGLRQGFVQFGTAGHLILRLMHDVGDVTNLAVRVHLEVDERWAAVTLSRLTKHGFIFKKRKLPKYQTGERTAWVWTLYRPRGHVGYRRATSAERTRVYREKRARMALIPPRVNSIFQEGMTE
jgi:hypothetical protein